MTDDIRPELAAHADLRAIEPRLLLEVHTGHNTCHMYVTGELDLATRDQLVAASTAGHHPSMVIDLGGVTFMDCSGYGSIVASRRIIERQGRTLTIVGQTGQPGRLFDLIAEIEKCPLRASRNRRPASPHHRTGGCDPGALQVTIRSDR